MSMGFSRTCEISAWSETGMDATQIGIKLKNDLIQSRTTGYNWYFSNEHRHWRSKDLKLAVFPREISFLGTRSYEFRLIGSLAELSSLRIAQAKHGQDAEKTEETALMSNSLAVVACYFHVVSLIQGWFTTNEAMLDEMKQCWMRFKKSQVMPLILNMSRTCFWTNLNPELPPGYYSWFFYASPQWLDPYVW